VHGYKEGQGNFQGHGMGQALLFKPFAPDARAPRFFRRTARRIEREAPHDRPKAGGAAQPLRLWPEQQRVQRIGRRPTVRA